MSLNHQIQQVKKLTKLLKFILKITQIITEQIKSNLQKQIFSQYDLLNQISLKSKKVIAVKS